MHDIAAVPADPVRLLPLTVYRLEFVGQPGRDPKFAGSAWRGAFGYALKRTVCIMRMRPCEGCMLVQSCAYPYIFETRPPATAQRMRKYTTVPHPFALRVGDAVATATETRLPIDLVLVGHARRFAAYALLAFARAGEHGIGSARRPFGLRRIALCDADGEPREWQEFSEHMTLPREAAPLVVPPCPGPVAIRLESPLRLRDQDGLVTPERFTAAHLLGSLVRRVSMLAYFHGEAPLDADFVALREAGRAVPLLERDLRWFDWTRWSSRQRTTMEMGGIVGSATLDLASHAQLWPFLWLGRWVGAGKGTSMGLGAFSLVPFAASPGSLRQAA